MSILCDDDIYFDEDEWNKIIYSDEILNENFELMDVSNENLQHKDIIKLSVNDFTRSTFINCNHFIQIGRAMTILAPPSRYQRVRYENECKQIFRYISIPNNRTLTIEIPDLRDALLVNDALWIRITRTTVNYRSDQLIFYHPYPMWIKNPNARIHNGSFFIPITNKDMKNGFIQIDTLAMIRLKQDELKKIDTFAVFSPAQLNIFGVHPVENDTAKRIRDEYHLRESILNFQLVRVDQNNIAYPTDCFCQTEALHELEANEQQKLLEMKIKEKNIQRRKKT